MDGNEHITDHFSSGSPTLREARARLCRCVYEIADPVKRMDDFFDCMKVNAAMGRSRLDLESEPFPMVQDVRDARPGELGDWESFLPAWEQKLASCETSRAAVLRMEALEWLEGIDAVSRLAGEWQSRQPYGYRCSGTFEWFEGGGGRSAPEMWDQSCPEGPFKNNLQLC
jgi:hypothetical protein